LSETDIAVRQECILRELLLLLAVLFTAEAVLAENIAQAELQGNLTSDLGNESINASSEIGFINTSSSENESLNESCEAHVYVSNKDDDRLAVSLFIDSELEGSEDLASDDEQKFGTYQLARGAHSFKIAWRDEDTKKNYEEETVQEIKGGDTVMLYTSENDAPETYEISAFLKNENDIDLDAYLYVDGDYEKEKEASKESLTELGSIELEEGAHEILVRWQDPDTMIEYEKRKNITVDREDAVIFYAPKGASFQKLTSDLSSSQESETSTQSSSSYSSSSFDTVTSSSAVEESSAVNESGAADENQSEDNETSETTTEIPSSQGEDALKSETTAFEETSYESMDESSYDFSALTSFDFESLPSIGRDGGLYIYGAVLVIAIYLFFRH
jgi:hypothetical protein